MDSPVATQDTSSTKPSSAQEQARLRRERRNAKIQAGGASRLNAITSLNGGHSAPAPLTKPIPASLPTQALAPADPTPYHQPADPDEVDISQHYYTPQTQARLPPSRSPQPFPFAFNGTDTPPFPQPSSGSDPNQSPMMEMLQQILGAGGGDSNNPQMPPNVPPGLAQMFSGMQTPTAEPPARSSAYLWRIVHALFSLTLALYITLSTSFTGSKLSRTHPQPPSTDDWADQTSIPSSTLAYFFYAFATFEVVLQTSRYFVERGQLPPSGFLGGVAQILPEPYSGYVRVVGRYSVIWKTVTADAMVVVFVLGAMAWWRDGAMA
ncbi:hypothetical protein K432DRAFT_342621 [Lepidopterella palustris CBS 459.81]|uniref:Uncharacterized protein n=1 Tax=Lepidopterella palustris CBS 459.81 TaxID=1314670 RepID=A0A8E2EL15_9PEZI|nr:hypothetical protein K432DRAFT_342621 [Lepidopterella palustris CBS 459.81]